MTKKEFIDYVKNLKESKETLTEEDLIDIGIKHQSELFDSDKNWPELVSLLGISKTGEQFRKWILNKRYAKGLVTKNPRILDNKTVEDATLSDVSNSLTKQHEDLFKQKQQVRDTYNAYRRNLRDDARIDDLKDLFVTSIANLNKLPLMTSLDLPKGATKEAVLMLSDLHIGVECDNFYNKYNLDIAEKRLMLLADKTIEYCHTNGVKKLSVCNLGDCVHGLIHISARLEQQMDTVDQVIKASELIARFLNRLTSGWFDINYRSCSDNHSRIIANKNESIEKDNLGRIIDWYLQSRLENTKINFINDNLDYGIGKFKVFNKNIVFVHGHNDSIDKMMQNMVGATGEIVDYALMGHYHCEKMKSYQNFKVFVNGSIVGTESYALEKRLFSKPSQTLLIFNDKDDDIVNVSINLETK